MQLHFYELRMRIRQVSDTQVLSLCTQRRKSLSLSIEEAVHSPQLGIQQGAMTQPLPLPYKPGGACLLLTVQCQLSRKCLISGWVIGSVQGVLKTLLSFQAHHQWTQHEWPLYL